MHKLLYVVFIGLMAGCASSSNKSVNLVGDWLYADGLGYECLLSFREDGTFAGHLGKKEAPQSFSGRWRRKNDRIYYIYSHMQLRPDLAGAKDEDRIIEISSAYFVIEARGGAHRCYQRVGMPNQ